LGGPAPPWGKGGGGEIWRLIRSVGAQEVKRKKRKPCPPSCACGGKGGEGPLNFSVLHGRAENEMQREGRLTGKGDFLFPGGGRKKMSLRLVVENVLKNGRREREVKTLYSCI